MSHPVPGVRRPERQGPRMRQRSPYPQDEPSLSQRAMPHAQGPRHRPLRHNAAGRAAVPASGAGGHAGAEPGGGGHLLPAVP